MKKVNFGYKEVEENLKLNLVQNLFNNVSSKYDLMNDVLSLGTHRFWKEYFIRLIPPSYGSLLDVASGTGDIAFKYYKRNLEFNNVFDHNILPDITLCDVNLKMLEIAYERAVDQNILPLKYAVSNAENLPFADNSFDYYTIAFGIRNVTNIELVLQEAFRVLKPMGKFLCLEFSKVSNPFLSKLYDYYSFNIIPSMGKIITGDKEAYQYLVESIRKFPDQQNFARMITEAGFTKSEFVNLSKGVVAIHTASKII